MVEERKVIFEKCMPELQEFCAEHGLHIQIMDLSWREADAADISAWPTRLAEINSSQKVSIGPNFIVSIYGVKKVKVVFSIFYILYVVLIALRSIG